MRSVNGDSRAVNSALETINAAATVIASSESSRVARPVVQKRRWGGWWSIYWCFGAKHKKQIGHAVLPETSATVTDIPAPSSSNQAPSNSIVLPFIAPPSSPASFLQSEPPSVTQSPTGALSFTSMSASMFSPGPASIFAIGPYAHETQLVSPPVFSTFTTEPSTAPFTPPPESVHLTTPSSPEVPFAQLLDPNLRSGEPGRRFPFSYYEFQSYQLQPGSPIGQLISPSSGISGSGTSSPFPDHDFPTGGPNSLAFRVGDPPKLLNLDRLSSHDWGSRRDSGSLTLDTAKPKSPDGFLLGCQIFEVASQGHLENGLKNDQTVVEHRVSFELKTETTARRDHSVNLMNGHHECYDGDTTKNITLVEAPDNEDQQHQKNRTITLGSIKEFNFDNIDGGDFPKPRNGSEWWANEKVAGKEYEDTKNWAFFPMIQPGVS